MTIRNKLLHASVTRIAGLGRRHATLEATGTWEAAGDDGRMELLTAGGVLGRCTSRSTLIAPLPDVTYRGHVVRQGQAVNMRDCVTDAGPSHRYEHPTVLIIGSSMSAGKTTAARVIIGRLRSMGLRVMGAKVSGAGRYRDVLTMQDAGARVIYDFVDAGLPSTVVSETEYEPAFQWLRSRMGQEAVDVAVVEVGASPLEPYNGALAVRELLPMVQMTVLCASDPYAVVGLTAAFETEIDLVTGTASNTLAGIELVGRLTGAACLDVRDRESIPALDSLLRGRLRPADQAL